MFGFRTDNILPKDGYVGLRINTGKVYEPTSSAKYSSTLMALS